MAAQPKQRLAAVDVARRHPERRRARRVRDDAGHQQVLAVPARGERAPSGGERRGPVGGEVVAVQHGGLGEHEREATRPPDVPAPQVAPATASRSRATATRRDAGHVRRRRGPIVHEAPQVGAGQDHVSSTEKTASAAGRRCSASAVVQRVLREALHAQRRRPPPRPPPREPARRRVRRVHQTTTISAAASQRSSRASTKPASRSLRRNVFTRTEQPRAPAGRAGRAARARVHAQRARSAPTSAARRPAGRPAARAARDASSSTGWRACGPFFTPPKP